MGTVKGTARSGQEVPAHGSRKHIMENKSVTQEPRMSEAHVSTLSAQAATAFRKDVEAWKGEAGLSKAQAKALDVIVEALVTVKHATNSWQLAEVSDVSEGTLYAVITLLNKAGLITRVAVGRSHFYTAKGATVKVAKPEPKAEAPKADEAPKAEEAATKAS